MSRRVSNVALIGPGMERERRGSRIDGGGRRLTLSSVHRPSIGDVGTHRRGTHARLPLVKMENTYQLEPHSDQRFREGAVRQVVEECFSEIVGDMHYEAEQCAFTAKRLSNAIRTQVRDLGYSRYKLVAVVYMGPRDSEQAASMASRCLWRPESGDSFVDVYFENDTVFTHVTVYATYFE